MAPRFCGPTTACKARPAPSSIRDLDWTKAELLIRKGFRRDIDSYSAFFENDHRTPTGLGGYLKERGFTQVALAGLATDFCVHYSAMDARSWASR
jgi:nicotinamidase/pyrazinamidase